MGEDGEDGEEVDATGAGAGAPPDDVYVAAAQTDSAYQPNGFAALRSQLHRQTVHVSPMLLQHEGNLLDMCMWKEPLFMLHTDLKVAMKKQHVMYLVELMAKAL